MNALLVALVLCAKPAPVEESCALDPKELKPLFAAKLPKGFKRVSLKKEKRHVAEVLKLADGTEVTGSAGGCAHYGLTLAIKNKTLTTKTVASELVATARRVLPQLPFASGEESVRDSFLKGLDEASITGLPARLPCGDATCELSLAPVEGKKPPKKAPAKGKAPEKKDEPPEADKAAEERPAQLVLSYDFAL